MFANNRPSRSKKQRTMTKIDHIVENLASGPPLTFVPGTATTSTHPQHRKKPLALDPIRILRRLIAKHSYQPLTILCTCRPNKLSVPDTKILRVLALLQHPRPSCADFRLRDPQPSTSLKYCATARSRNKLLYSGSEMRR
jgi:hypothetical protein